MRKEPRDCPGVYRIPMRLEDYKFLIDRRKDKYSVDGWAKWCNVTTRAVYKFESGETQSPRMLVYYMHLLSASELSTLVTKLVTNDKELT